MLKYLNQVNQEITIFDIESSDFLPFGRCVKGYDFSPWITYMVELSEMPLEGNCYYPHIKDMEETEIFQTIQQVVYGNMEIQVGYCNGKNSFLNGLEYHKGNELFIAVTDLVVFLGLVQDIHNNCYETDKAKAFFVPKGTCLELYGTSLHSAPAKLSEEGFMSIVVLPRHTNNVFSKDIEIKETSQEDPEQDLLFRINKWLLVHESHMKMVSQGAYIGLQGKNCRIMYE